MKPFLLLIPIILLSSCLHKPVMDAEADDVSYATVYHENGKDHVIAMEEVFQANRKSHEHGVTRISGYSDLRLSVYDAQTGALITRKKAGRVVEGKHTEVLGLAGGKLWLYSQQDEKGLHALHPVTLDEVISQNQIIDKNPLLAGELAVPKYNAVHSLYRLDVFEQRLLLTDVSGYRYQLNLADLSAERLEEELSLKAGFMNRISKTNYFERKVAFEGAELKLTGDTRMSLQVSGDSTAPELSYLDGHFIGDKNEERLHALLKSDIDAIARQLSAIRHAKDSITEKHGESLTSMPREARSIFRELDKQEHKLSRDRDALERQVDLLKRGTITFSYDVPLQDTPGTLFIAHRNTLNEDAFLVVSKIEDGKEKWSAEIDGIFYDFNTARETNSFKVVFSKGNPDFGFQYFEAKNQKLIVFYMLHAFCIDTETGIVLWKIRV